MRSRNVIALFSLAGFLAALPYACYSLWVNSLEQANFERHQYEQNFLLPDYSPVKADQDWARENIRLTKYANRQWLIFCLAFPSGITLALLIAVGLRWLPQVPIGRMLAALFPIYVAPWLVLFFCAISRFMLLLPMLVFAAYFVRWSAEIMASRRQRRFVLTLMIFSIVCFAFFIGMSALPGLPRGNSLPGAVTLVALQVLWAGKYGSALAVTDGPA